MKYHCPKCKSNLEIQKTFNKKIVITCSSCGLQDILEFRKNLDEAILDLGIRFDEGEIPDKVQMKNDLEKEGIIRKKDEIEAMIGKSKLDSLTKNVLFSKKDYVSHFKTIKKPEPVMGSNVEDVGLGKEISSHLNEIGITKFYKFQEEAIKEIFYGNSVVIEAPTASGKTEAFLIPIIQKIKNENLAGKVSALFVYPTKSLARDQYPKIVAFAEKLDIKVAVFDGDTKQTERSEILEDPPHIIVTNFDILHYHMMYHTKFASLLSGVKFLVADEAHVYSGIFGSNVHYIVKRLKRLSNKIQFVAASATLDNAVEFCEKLFGVPMKLIHGSGNKSETDFVMLFPSLRTQRALMVDLIKKLTDKKHKTMAFSNSHRNSELLAMQAKKQKVNIKVHRAGLMANYRKAVERDFKQDVLLAISCTPTLELGIDVGNVDGVISATIPVNRLTQRIGRAARKGQRGYAFLALGNDPISQYYKNHPDDYFDDVEHTYIDPKNPFVEEFHVMVMACDKPISKHELKEHNDVIERHVKNGYLILEENRFVPNRKKIQSMLGEYSIRGIGKSIDIFLDGRKVGDRNLPIALEELHKDAIYFLAGTRYKVLEFNYPEKTYAKLQRIPRDYPYYTKSLTSEWPTIETVYEKRKAFGLEIAFCKLHIQKTVYGYVNMEIGQEIAQGKKVVLEKPLEYDFITKGIVFHAPRPLNEMKKSEDEEYVEASAYHATEHVVIEGSNMITGGVSQDLGGISLGTSGLIFIYDGAIGGNGASKALYDRFEKALERSMYIVKECPCTNESGCPRCTFSYRCGNNNEFLHKHSSLEVFQRIVDGEETELEDPMEGDKPLV